MTRTIKWIHAITLFFILGGCLPFIQTITGLYNRGQEFPEPLEPPCQYKCAISVPRSSVIKFDSFSLDSTQVLFVHFSTGLNISLKSSDTADILDPLNLVWVESSEAPFLSFDLGFNAYSITTLSKIGHHMEFKVEVEPFICLQNMSHSCVTANLARAFLGNVTRERGVLCYAVNDSNTVNYRCCKGNPETHQVECDIPAVFSLEMSIIFITIAIVTLIGLACLPALLDIFPDKKNSYSLSANSQVHDPLFHLLICTVQAVRRYSNEDHCVNVLTKLFIGLLALPVLYYSDLVVQWYTITYDIPKMFNERVRELWLTSKAVYFKILADVSHWTMQLIISSLYWIPVVFLSLLKLNRPPRSSSMQHLQDLINKEKNMKINWRIPCDWTKDCWSRVKSLFDIVRDPNKACLLRFVAFLGSFLLMLLTLVFPFVSVIYYGCWYISPLKKMISIFFYRLSLNYNYYSERETCKQRMFRILRFYFGICIISLLFYIASQQLLMSSLLIAARLVVYLWMGIVASKDYYFPRVAVSSVVVYYCWNCFSSVKSRYEVLLQQTFAKCKEHQEKQPNGRKALIFNDKGVPSISSELFKKVIEEILPKSEVYTKMILKLTTIILFLFLTCSSILVYGSPNLNQSTQALAVLLTGLLPKLFEVFGEGSSYQQLCEMEISCRVEKIVNDFLNSNTSDGGRAEEQQLTNNFGDQLPSTSTNYAMELDELNLEEREYPARQSGDADDETRIILSEGNDRKDLDVFIHSLVNPRVQHMKN